MSSRHILTGPYATDQSLHAAIYDAMLFSIMIGIGESYLGAFGIALGGTPVQIGMLATLPPLVGALFQLAGLWLISKNSNRRRLIVLGASLQGLAWIPIAILPILFGHGKYSVAALIALVVLYQASGNITGPAWNSLIGDLVPNEIRGKYFGFRNQQAGWVTLVSLISGGVLLHHARSLNDEYSGFLILFVTAAAARLASAYWLARYKDPGHTVSEEDYFSFRDFLRRTPKSNFAQFVLFVSLFNMGLSMAGPYFAMYMFNDLHWTYRQFMFSSAVNLVFQFITMKNWGRLSDQFGNKRILGVSATAVALSPLLWLFTDTYWMILVIQCYAGVFWAGYSLSAANFLFDAVTPQKRARCAAYMSVINSVCVFFGSMIGGLATTQLPPEFLIAGGALTPTSIYLKAFLLSGIVRFCVVGYFLPRFREVREVDYIRNRDLIFRVTNIRPITGATFSIVTGIFKPKR